MAIINRRRISEVLSFCHLPFFQRRTDPDYVQPGDVDEDGNIIVTLYTGNAPTPMITPDMDGQSPNGQNVSNIDTTVIAANPNRVALVMTNDSISDMYIGLGASAAVNGAPRLNANGGVYTISRYGPVFTTGAIHAIHGAGAVARVLTFQEFH